LDSIWQFSAQAWSVRQADRYIASLADTIALLCRTPQMARERTEFHPPVRVHWHAQHLII
jgi:toxin ParE1/3/4